MANTKEKSIKDKIKDIKNLTGLTNKEVADLIGADKACVTRWLQGYYQPSLKYNAKINELYDQAQKQYSNYNKPMPGQVKLEV